MQVGDTITDGVNRVWQLTAIAGDTGQRPTSEDFVILDANQIGDFARFALYREEKVIYLQLRPLQWKAGERPPDFLGFLEFCRVQ